MVIGRERVELLIFKIETTNPTTTIIVSLDESHFIYSDFMCLLNSFLHGYHTIVIYNYIVLCKFSYFLPYHKFVIHTSYIYLYTDSISGTTIA